MSRIFLSIGSNIEPEKNFKCCAKALNDHFSGTKWSPIYRSKAVGMDGDDFLNAVVLANTQQSVISVVSLINDIEHSQGRERSANKFTSRTLDIDLLLYDDLILKSARITLPRPEITSAAHVLVPLVDLIPNDIHPLLNETYANLLNQLEEQQPDLKTALTTVNLSLY